jgi:ribose transport system permease protein
MNNKNQTVTQLHQDGRTAAGVPGKGIFDFVNGAFVRFGVLPFLLVLAVVIFALLSDQFLTSQNLINLLRQSTYLILVAIGQMLVLVTGGFDLSVGTILAVTSVVSAMVMSNMVASSPDAVWTAIVVGSLAGILAGSLIGVINGIGVAYFGVSPFIMTMGIQSVGFGVALFLTGGVPVAGLPGEFGEIFGFGSLLGVPIPILVTGISIVIFYLMMDRTSLGNYIYAVGGNSKAATLSGINTKRVLILAYVLCAVLAAVSGLLLTGRTESGEANIGGTVALESIAACVIAGVSLRGGIGRVQNVVLGAIFIVLVQNGMNLASVGSYLQMVVLGGLLIFAVIANQLRYKKAGQ